MDLQKELENFLANYGKIEAAQENEDAIIDSQIKNLSLPLADAIAKSPSGSVIDIGCGNGILLRRLSEIKSFLKNNQWFYIGTDFQEKLKKIVDLAYDLGIHRRVDVINLDNLYASWLESLIYSKPLIVIIRNVFHELNINKTAELLYSLTTRLETNDLLIIQDINVFPIAERGNVCWISSNFVSLLEFCGFNCTWVDEPTSKGNRWFTLIARLNKRPAHNLKEISDSIILERKKQYEYWTQIDSVIPKDFERKNNQIALIDFDLQLAALQRQLVAINAIDVKNIKPIDEKRISKEIFAKNLIHYNSAILEKGLFPLERPVNFRDRANSQDALESFLLSNNCVCVIRGGPFMGKTDLVAEVLTRRSHGRQIVLLDVQYTVTVWNLVEQFLAGIDCILPHDLLRNFTSTSFSDLTPSLSKLIASVGDKIIVVIDHFERLLDPNKIMQDAEIIEFIRLIASTPDSKVIITSRTLPNLSFFPRDLPIDNAQPPVGRFPQGKHVENVLDDFIDRATFGIQSYPEELIQSIDRIPYLTVLAAKIIRKEGPDALNDPHFIALIRNRLREELLQRVITDPARPALNIASFLRIPIPRSMFVGLVDKESVQEAEDIGLLYHTHDRYGHNFLSAVSTLRFQQDETEEYLDTGHYDENANNKIDEQHYKISKWYERLYREEGDPRWIREAYYHAVSAGDTQALKQFGTIYRGELFWAGDYWFRVRKNFKASLDAFIAAKKLGLHTYRTDLRIAACMFRCKRVKEGEELYNELFEKYNNAKGAKTSYIDSLLYVYDFRSAIDKLHEFNLPMTENAWVAHQYGRAYFGLRHYRESLNAFKVSLNLRGEAIDYYSVARSHHRLGERENVGMILSKGINLFQKNFRLKLSYASHLIQTGEFETRGLAEKYLHELHDIDRFHGGVLQQLCKLLCSAGRSQEAIQLIGNDYSQIFPESYRLPINTEILMTQGRWNEAVSKLENIPEDDEHLVGLKKKVYLRWAQAEVLPETIQQIAIRGLNTPMSPVLNTNIPIMVTSARLALIGEDNNAFQDILNIIKEINPNIAESLIQEETSLHYWDDDSFSY